MDTVDKIVNINSRLDHLESAAEWISRETVHSDNAVSQTSTLIQVLVDDIREKVFAVIRELEQQAQIVDADLH
jgi:hypothetical protein